MAREAWRGAAMSGVWRGAAVRGVWRGTAVSGLWRGAAAREAWHEAAGGAHLSASPAASSILECNESRVSNRREEEEKRTLKIGFAVLASLINLLTLQDGELLLKFLRKVRRIRS